jgi:hypothetical protein
VRGSGGSVCARLGGERKWGCGGDQKTEKGTWLFSNPPIFIG